MGYDFLDPLILKHVPIEHDIVEEFLVGFALKMVHKSDFGWVVLDHELSRDRGNE